MRIGAIYGQINTTALTTNGGHTIFRQHPHSNSNIEPRFSDDEKDLMKHAGPCLAQDTGSTMRCEIIGACRYYLETSSERQAKAGRFPTLTNLIQPSNQFHSPPFPRYSD